MKIMRYVMHILLLIALVVSFSPCGHAEVHTGHQHDEAAGFCDISCDPCECHSCNDESCSDDLDLERDKSGSSFSIAEQPAAGVAKILPYRSEQLKINPPPLISAILAALRTVRLLI